MAIEYVASTGVQSGAQNTAINKPTGTVEGDLMLWGVLLDASTLTRTIQLPGGWTQVLTEPSPEITFKGAWKIAGASEPSSYTYTIQETSHASRSIMATFRGHDPVTPIDATAGEQILNHDSFTYNAPGVTLSKAGSLVVSMAGDGGGIAWTLPSGFTALQLMTGLGGGYKLDVAAGATGTFAWTTNSASADRGGMTFGVSAAGAADFVGFGIPMGIA